MPNHLMELFLDRNGSDPIKALEDACQTINALLHDVSSGYVRSPPRKPALPNFPKFQIEPIDGGWPDPGSPDPLEKRISNEVAPK